MTIAVEEAFKTLENAIKDVQDAFHEAGFLACKWLGSEQGLLFAIWRYDDADFMNTVCTVKVKDSKISIQNAGGYLSESEWILTVFREVLAGDQ